MLGIGIFIKTTLNNKNNIIKVRLKKTSFRNISKKSLSNFSMYSFKKLYKPKNVIYPITVPLKPSIKNDKRLVDKYITIEFFIPEEIIATEIIKALEASKNNLLVGRREAIYSSIIPRAVKIPPLEMLRVLFFIKILL